MKALIWEAARTMSMREENQPESPANEILVKVDYVGICGSELSGYLGHNALRVPPLIMGHEFAGEIVAVGPMVSTLRPDLTMGSLVTVNPLWNCGECAQCVCRLHTALRQPSAAGRAPSRRFRGVYQRPGEAGLDLAGGHGQPHRIADRAGRLCRAHRRIGR